jgi:hypothetical protein
MQQDTKGSQTSVPSAGRYANFFKIGHNAFELGQRYAGNEKPQLHTRIVTSSALREGATENVTGISRRLREGLWRYRRITAEIDSTNRPNRREFKKVFKRSMAKNLRRIDKLQMAIIH